MHWLTEDAKLVCKHEMGKVQIVPSQNLVFVNGRRVLVEIDPEGKAIAGCPNYGPTIKPCTATLRVMTGYSNLLRVGGRKISLDTVTGLTDGTPPGTVLYEVRNPGQQLVREGA